MSAIEVALIAVGVSVVSAIVSICSLCVSIRKYSADKSHQANTLKPYLVMMHSRATEKGMNPNFPDQWFIWTIKLSNTGLGPAIIDSFLITIDGKPVAQDGKDQWIAVKKWTEQKYQLQAGFKYVEIGKGYSLEKGTSVDILSVRVTNSEEQKRRLAEAICSCRIVIQHHSFAGESLTFDTDNNKTTPDRLFS